MAMNGKFTVLLVEDEPIIRMGVADYISSQGYEVIEAGSGDRAVDIIKSGTPVDIIVTAIQMPGENDGIALALWARRDFPGIVARIGELVGGRIRTASRAMRVKLAADASR